jgi:ABC-type sugar transport system ATPase subunit
MDYLLEMKGIRKKYPGVLALNNVDLELRKGEVLALLGENGAGKSTLIKVLSGACAPESGEIHILGKLQKYTTPKEAADIGISIIYQELNYLNDLTVAENIFLNRLPVKKPFGSVDWRRIRKDARGILAGLNVSIDDNALMRDLSVAEKQLVEIAKALSRKMKILVMDEPSSALSDKEVARLLELVKQMANEGVGVIYISHRLDELFGIADRVQVMRDGERVGVLSMSETTREELVQLMVGRKLKAMYPKRSVEKKEVVLKVENLQTDYLKNISFHVRAGEILGVFGLMGSGRTEMANCLFGAARKKSSTVEIGGKRARINSPKDAIKAGLGYMTSERKKDGLIMIQSVSENIMTASINEVSSAFRMNRRIEKTRALFWKEKLDIKTPDIGSVVEGLSGGNQQKVVLSKWLQTKPKVLLLNEPTRGIDVGAKVEIYKLLEGLCEEGVGIVMISSELQEILQLSDRVIVLSEGRLAAQFDREELTQERVMHSAVGGS